MKDYAIITLGETPTLIHSTRNVAKQIYDTAAFIECAVKPLPLGMGI